DHKVVVSKDALELVERYLVRDGVPAERRYEVLFNGVENDRIRAVPRGQVTSSTPAILFLGRHEERKGLQVLLEALQHVRGDVTVWVAGDGPDTDRLRAAFAGDRRVQWLGRISEDDKLARLRSADVF